MKLILSALLTVVSMQAFADIVKPLPKGDSLGKVAKAVGTQLGDGNISTGTTQLWAGELKRREWFKGKEEFKAYVKAGFAESFKDDREETLPTDAKIQVTVSQFVDGDGKNGTVHKMAAAIMESNDYNTENRDIWKGSARYVWAVLRKLPVSKQTLVGHAKTRIIDSSSGEERTIQYFLLVNKDRKAVQLFTIEGSM
jgi:hypothetical protein